MADLKKSTKLWLKKSESTIFKLNFYRIHLAYFILVILLSSVIVYGSTTNGNSGDEEALFFLRYIDALFLCTSAMTNTGLNTVNLGSITAFQQVVLFLLIPLGNIMIVSTSSVYIRKHFFKKRMSDLVKHSKAARDVAGDVERQESNSTKSKRAIPDNRVPRNHPDTLGDLRRRKPQETNDEESDYYAAHHLVNQGGFPMPWDSKRLRSAFHAPFRTFHTPPHDKQHGYLSFQPALDHKGRFMNLNEKEREELGGVEYRALHLLGWLLPAYYLFWIALGIIILVPYSYRASVQNVIRTSQPGNLNPGWWATFSVMSAFGNCGLNLMDSNLVPFETYYLVLIVLGTLILTGNQLFPVFLRLIIWIMYKLVPRNSEIHHTLAFLLHHPRRCFLLLFPGLNTWYLFAAQVSIDLALWFFFGILNIGTAPLEATKAGDWTMMGLFQGLGVRVGGLYVILMSNLAPALQILYLVAMYISALPIILSLRQTNVYEERSIGVKDSGNDESKGDKGPVSHLGVHLRKQLAYDLWWIVVAIWLVSIIERGQIINGGDYFTTWAIIFEVVSAYGTVGLSLGVPYDSYSFCGSWHTLSKLVLILVMLRGRHRGLPYAIDRAVLLPGEDLMERMDEEYNRRGSDSKYKREEHKLRYEERGEEAEPEHQGGEDPDEQELKGEDHPPEGSHERD